MHALFDAPLERFLHTRKAHFGREALAGESEAEFTQRLADELEALIQAEGPDTVAAFIGEPVMGAGGVFTPPEGYWPAIQAVCRRHDVLVIADEVICGFGRLGTPFGAQRYGIEPDLMVVAKAITSGYYPVSAVLLRDALFEEFAVGSQKHGPLAHGHTTSLHPVGAAAALANLDIYEREGLWDRAARIGPAFHRRLREATSGHPHVGEVRGEGLIAAVELVADARTRAPFPAERRAGMALHHTLLGEGVYCRALGDSLAFCPPLVIGEDELEEAITRFVRGLERWTSEPGAEG
jgi:adenosylmethionine-8-amino-7-oxononanoate aminotransferase